MSRHHYHRMRSIGCGRDHPNVALEWRLKILSDYSGNQIVVVRDFRERIGSGELHIVRESKHDVSAAVIRKSCYVPRQIRARFCTVHQIKPPLVFYGERLVWTVDELL